MDFSKFADDNFDCKEWVNAALRAKKDSQTPLDVRVLCGLWFNRTLTQVARGKGAYIFWSTYQSRRGGAS